MANKAKAISGIEAASPGSSLAEATSPPPMHAIEHKLKYEIYPYLVTAQQLKKWRPLLVYNVYVYCGELFVLLAGFGVANPLMSALTGNDVNKIAAASSSKQTVIQFLGSGYAALLAVVLLLVWGTIKFYVRREELEKRSNLLRSCILQCSQFENKVHNAVPHDDPMSELLDVQEKLSDLIERNIVERAWPFPGPEPGIQHLVDQQVDVLIEPFKRSWKTGPDQRPKG